MDPFDFEKRINQAADRLHTEVEFLDAVLNKFYDRIERTDAQVVCKLSFAERAEAVNPS